jgi:hypothetical protein
MADLHFWFEQECLLHTRCTTCNGARIFMAQTLSPSDQKDGRVLSSLI